MGVWEAGGNAAGGPTLPVDRAWDHAGVEIRVGRDDSVGVEGAGTVP